MSSKAIAIVTGASSGLGKEFTRLLAPEPGLEEIWAVARHRETLKHLEREFGSSIRPFAADLSRQEERLKLSAVLQNEQPHLRYLVNCAGYAKFCSYEDLSLQDSLDILSLNIDGVVAMGLIGLPYMRRGDHLINIASQAAFQPLPYQNLYSCTKAFVRHYSRALNQELKERGIVVTAVCPGWMDTALYQRADIGADKGTRHFPAMASPAKVAEKALRDAWRGRDQSVYSLYVKSAHIAAKLLPQKMMMALWLRQQGL